MGISDSEKLDRILKSYVLEVQSWANKDFKYAMARSDFMEDRSGGDSAELIFVMRRKPQDLVFLSDKITKLTARYRRKYKIALRPAFQWEEEGCCETVAVQQKAEL